MEVLDWSRCIICQKDGFEPLKCPLNSPHATSQNRSSAYINFLTNVEQFRKIEALPVELPFGEEETAESFISNSASWHKSCYLKFNNCKLAKAIKKREREKDESGEKYSGPNSKKRRSQKLNIQQCFLCNESEEIGVLHQVLTYDADANIRAMISELNDAQLLARIVGGDLIATEVKYHHNCLTKLRNRYRSHIRMSSKETQKSTGEKMNESVAFVELTTYIEKAVDSGVLLFKLSEVHSLYVNRLEEMGTTKQINKTRLKNSLMQHFPEAQEQFDGHNVCLVFKEGMANLLKDALKKRDFSEDATILAKAAVIIREDIFSHQGFQFTGQFQSKCQEDSLPSSLKSLISMILNGPNLKDQDRRESQPCLTIGQTILYNAKKSGSSSYEKTRHLNEREPPLPVYLGINIHSQTRSKKLIQQLYQLGISISYHRVLEIENLITTSVCKRYEEEGVVSPNCLRKGLFTVGALDNLDHNPSSTTAVNSFHGTGISLFQCPSKEKSGEERQPILLSKTARMHDLPDSYAIVPAVSLKTTAIAVPECVMSPTENSLNEAIVHEHKWVEHALPLLQKETLSNDDVIAWAAYHATLQPPVEDPPAVCALLPLFYEKAATPAMVKHGMDVQRQATQHLNPGQIPVTTFDQPLFALAKFVQWKWPLIYGEKVHVVMLGGLHTEMALWKTLGDVLDGSGWTEALIEAEVASSGVAESFLKTSHLTRTRHGHQVSLLALYNLQREAFMLCEGPKDEKSQQLWRNDMVQKSPTFAYWDLIIRYETLILLFVRAHRERNFSLYVQLLEELTPLFFALDHVNYARWMPVHIRDMKSLPAPVKEEFENDSHWVISKTMNSFSAIPFDQAHEQENKIVKGSGGAVGLTENPAAFKRWMLSGPEVARLVIQFQEENFSDDDPEIPKNFKHHEQGISTQKTFHKQVNSLSATIKRMGNPFLDDFSELVTLNSRDCMDESVIQVLRNLEDTGKKQYQSFVKDVLEDRTRSIHEPIKRNSLVLMKRSHGRTVSRKGKKIKILQNNVELFGQLYIAMQSRDGDLNEFFAHEIQSFPPSLSDFGSLRLTNAKSELLQCLEQPDQTDPPSIYDCKIFDGAVLVHFLPTTAVNTFDEYADKIFIPYLEKQLQESRRLDVVWDTYIANSLKESTRLKRGHGRRRKVSGETKLPKNWIDFLRDSTNKKELFAFLTTKVSNVNCPASKSVYITSGQSVLSVGSPFQMPNCNHEEADTRVVVHVMHALEQGEKTILIRTVDTDVVAILVGTYHTMVAVQPYVVIWVAFGTGRNYRFYSINTICRNIGEPRSRAIPVFHAFSGCDTTSAFNGKGKKSVWQAWQAYEDVTETLVYLAFHPFEKLYHESESFQKLERLVVILYDKTSSSNSVNEVRRNLFCQKNRAIDKLPPTQDALLQHIRRTVYQSGIWTGSTQTQPVVPSPEGYGWKKVADSWVPVWITVPEVSKACNELIKCSCKAECTRCKCAKANLECSPLCKCNCEQH